MRRFVWISSGGSLLSLCSCAISSHSEAEAFRTPVSHESSRWAYLAAQYDRNGDQQVERDEYNRGAEAFHRLDLDADGVITEDDFSDDLGMTPEQMNARVTRRVLMEILQGDEDLAHLDKAEASKTFLAIDSNDDQSVDLEEFEAYLSAAPLSPFATGMVRMTGRGAPTFEVITGSVDTDGDGSFALAELSAFFDAQDTEGTGVWFSDRVGEGGPEPGSMAPDFTLRSPDGASVVTLSALRGDRPVALIFGSYT